MKAQCFVCVECSGLSLHAGDCSLMLLSLFSFQTVFIGAILERYLEILRKFPVLGRTMRKIHTSFWVINMIAKHMKKAIDLTLVFSHSLWLKV